MKTKAKNSPSGFVVVKKPLLLLTLLGFALLFVWQRAYTVSLSKRITRLENELFELRAENSEKLIRIANLSSPERIERLARDVCGLRYSLPSERVCVVEEPASRAAEATRWRKSLIALKRFFLRQWERLVKAPLGGEQELFYKEGSL